jgi:hypothetical protein
MYMAARLNQRTVRRSPLPLTERDLTDLASFRGPGPAREALARLAAADLPEGDITESALLHAVFEAGLRAVRETAEELSYAADATAYQAEDAERRRIAHRRRPHWADED